MNQDISAILYDELSIQKRICELGEEISRDFEHKNPVFLSVLKGSVVFLADLMRACTIDITLDFVSISSYGDKTFSSGNIKFDKTFTTDVKDRDIIIIEDIIDSGLSLSYLTNYLKKLSPASISVCVLLDKAEARKIEVDINYRGFTVDNEFLVGYGLDYAERYRNLPFIGVLKEEIYK